MYLVISTSLNPESRSRILARSAHAALSKKEQPCELIDLADSPLPVCDGATAYGDPAVVKITSAIQAAQGILIASPVYNFDLSASAKNLIELTGKAWTNKVVGFLCAAGGQGSYMAPMQLANSLMLDFRTLVLPQFVYATGDMFQGDTISDSDIEKRIENLAEQLDRIATALGQ